MSLEAIAWIALALAGIPLAVYLANLSAYRRLPIPRELPSAAVSVLIPARNEEGNIERTLKAVLANQRCVFEVIVLDDHSTDRTAEIVQRIARTDSRVRLEEAPPLPPGWCGKQHACHVLAKRARNPLLVFIDADVTLGRNALARIAYHLQSGSAALSSGVPRQELGTFSERLLLPLIHTILLGFLPIAAMRRTLWPALSGGCGQLFAARKDAYDACGGHSAIKLSLHDGVKLPRVFRRGGFRTDLFDATDLAHCRMYHTNGDTWRGLEKNATEALAAPGAILPMSILLLGGQVLPFVLVVLAHRLSAVALGCAMAAALAALVPRLISAARFEQPIGSALLHPLGMTALVCIQWRALVKSLLGKPAEWKGRRYPAVRRAVGMTCLMLCCLSALSAEIPQKVELRDQFDVPQQLSFPAERMTILTVADRKGADQVDEWISALKVQFTGRVDFKGIANVGGVPGFLRAHVRKKFQETRKYPVMMDWTGKICEQLQLEPGKASVFVISRDGKLLGQSSGEARKEEVARLCDLIKAQLPIYISK